MQIKAICSLCMILVLSAKSSIAKFIIMYWRNALFIVFIFLVLTAGKLVDTEKSKPLKDEVWITAYHQNLLFKQEPLENEKTPENNLPVINIDMKKTYQCIDGFGFTLTGGSARLIHSMEANAQAALLDQLFLTSALNIGTSYLRVSIGASDLSDSVFTYNDLPTGQTDPELKSFSIEPELVHLVPVLRAIKAMNPEVQIMGSPWSAPAWMKDNQKMIGGRLLKKYYPVYAQYFVKYVQAMQKEGINIDAITVQNEPLHPGNNPSMYMPAEDQAEFVKNYLGPAFEKNRIATKIIIYDHNADKPEYPLTVLKDAEARKYIDGSAFHLYGGTIDALSSVHEAYPDKHLYFTEQWIGGPANFVGDLNWHIENLIIGATRNWCKTVLEWNLAADKNYDPHTDQGGCTRCLGAVTIDGNDVALNPAYYIIGHASKFVRPGSVRIASNLLPGVPNVAFLTPDHKVVLIAMNSTDATIQFKIQLDKKEVVAVLPSKAVGSYVLND